MALTLAEGGQAFQRRAATEEELARDARHWQWMKLEPIADALPPEWSDRYRALVDEFGEREHDLLSYVTTSWAREETLPVDLGSLSLPELVGFLTSWQPRDPFGSIGLDGLVQQLTGVVASNPGVYVEHSEVFKDLHPRYVRAFFAGVREAEQKDAIVDWANVLALADWVVTQRDEDVPAGGGRM